MHFHNHSIYCIVPPHMLKKIAENGSHDQAEKAMQTIVATEQLRGRRHGIASMAAFAMNVSSRIVAMSFCEPRSW